MIVIVILAAAVVTGIISVVALVCTGIAREERGRTLADRPASRTEAAARRIVGWHGEPPRIRSQADRQADYGGTRPGTRSLTLVSSR